MTIRSIITIAALPTLFVCSAAQAQLTAGNVLGAPAVLGGNIVTGAAAGHAGIAPTVVQAAPQAEPLADGVTSALGAVGTGTTGTGQNIQQGGLQVGTTSSGQPIASVGATQPGGVGKVVGVLNP